jgi:hypothetical protein
MRRTYDLIELIRKKSSMSADIVTKKDPEYGWYAGSSVDVAYQMAVLDTFLKHKLIPPNFVPLVKLYRSYLDQLRKAIMASTATEITKLGFILGDTRVVKRATAPATSY